MKLLRLRLENFRQHRNTDISFQDGMTAIVGSNGTGKTTLLEAITFALYGVQRKTKESIRFFWAEPRSKVRVTLEFEFEEKRFRLERSSTDASLVDVSMDPPVVKASGLREVKGACERLLRLTYDQFKNSFCAEQKNLTFLQFNTDTRRQEQVGKMLGLDRLKGAADLAREKGRSYRFLCEQLEKSLGDIGLLREQRARAETELREKLALCKQMSELRAALSAQLPAVEEAKKRADLYVRLTQEAAVYRSMGDGLKSARKMAEEAVALANADVQSQAKLKPLHAEYLRLDELVRDMQAQREIQLAREQTLAEQQRLAADVAALDKRIKALCLKDVEAARLELAKLSGMRQKAENERIAAESAWSKAKQMAQAALSTAQAEHRQASAALQKAKALVEKGVCPECGQPTTASFEDTLKCLEADALAAAAELSVCETRFKAAEERPKALFEADDALNNAQQALLKAQDSLTECEKEHAQAKALQDEREAKLRLTEELKAKLDRQPSGYDRNKHLATEERRNDLRASHESYLRIGDAASKLKEAQAKLTAAQAEFDQAREQYRLLMAERDKLGIGTATEAAELQVAYDSLLRQVGEAEYGAKQADLLAKHAEVQLKQAQVRIEEYEAAEQNLKENRRQALIHETVEKEMKLLREELNSVIRPDLEARASENLSLLTNGRYPVLELDEEFNPTVIEDGIAKQVISGGEEDVVALALRLALSELIQERQGRPMSLMILDEVFGGLDADRRQAVLERLQAIKGRFSQILVISHIEEINQVADQCIFLSRDSETRAAIVGDPPLDQLMLI